jgi:hypothetical protein
MTASHKPDGVEKFLSRKRDFVVPAPPPSIEISSVYLEEFARNNSLRLSSPVERLSDDVKEAQLDTTQRGNDEKILLATQPQIKFQNLLYSMTGAEVLMLSVFAPSYDMQLMAFALRYGVLLTHVEMGVDKKTRQPSGHAVASLAQGADPVAASGQLNGEICYGRAVRVFPVRAGGRQSFGGGNCGVGSRYFEPDISFKCSGCGAVGHKQAECVVPAAPLPCHFCAGSDHDAGVHICLLAVYIT